VKGTSPRSLESTIREEKDMLAVLRASRVSGKVNAALENTSETMSHTRSYRRHYRRQDES
jgi:hypothetical protein